MTAIAVGNAFPVQKNKGGGIHNIIRENKRKENAMQIEVFRKKDRYKTARRFAMTALLIVLGSIFAYHLSRGEEKE